MISNRYQVCEDCQPCDVDGCEQVAHCLADPTPHPCPHDRALCEDHNIEHCMDCRLDAEAHMFKAGEYDPRADPFYRPEKKAADDKYWTTDLDNYTESVRTYYRKGE